MTQTAVVALLALAVAPSAAGAQGAYGDQVLSTPSLTAYWRLDEASGTVAGDARGRAAGTYLGGPGLGVRGAQSAGAGTSARFDGVDDQMQTGVASIAESRGDNSESGRVSGRPPRRAHLAGAHCGYFA